MENRLRIDLHRFYRECRSESEQISEWLKSRYGMTGSWTREGWVGSETMVMVAGW